jgi:5'-3' exonuclease
MKNLIDVDILVYRTAFGYKDFGLFENIEGLDSAIIAIKNKFPDHKAELVISNAAKTFRHAIAVTKPYKGNRKAEKPKFYHELREYLIDELGATVSPEGFEADDYIGMNTNKRTDIISTIDKDLFMIPAKGHYNFVKDELVKIKRPSYYFWSQLLTGDTADNIPGLHLIGPKRAAEILDGLKTKEMRSAVEDQYKMQLGDSWFQRFDESAKLLWIKRHADKEYYDYL